MPVSLYASMLKYEKFSFKVKGGVANSASNTNDFVNHDRPNP